jgi:hypothetical protein
MILTADRLTQVAFMHDCDRQPRASDMVTFLHCHGPNPIYDLWGRMNSSRRENEKSCLRESQDVDLWNVLQSFIFREALKWTHNHWGHFAQVNCPKTGIKRVCVCYETDDFVCLRRNHWVWKIGEMDLPTESQPAEWCISSMSLHEYAWARFQPTEPQSFIEIYRKSVKNMKIDFILILCDF